MRISKVKILISCLLLGLTAANFASASLVNCKDDCTIPMLFTMIIGIINFLLSWSALVAILFVVWAGWQMISAGGNEESVSVAKTTLKNAVLGFVVVLTSFVLINAVVSVLTDGSFRAGAITDAFNLVVPSKK